MNPLLDAVVIGSGPAGLTAAHALAEQEKKVLLMERQKRLSVKLLASGGGRCNLSNTLSDEEFMSSFGRNGRFMEPALKAASREELFGFLQKSGVPVTAEDGFHYFPVSGRARDIAECYLSSIRKQGGEILENTEVTSILTEDGHISGVSIGLDDPIPCRTVVLAGGGTAWSSLGGTYAGLKLAEELGHTIATPRPAMAPLIVKDSWPGTLAGVSLPDSRLAFRSGRQVFTRRGELVFTHTGFSGPCALDLAGELAELTAKKGTAELIFQPDAEKDIAFWKKTLEEGRLKEGGKLVRTLIASFLPKSLADTLCTLAGCGERKNCELTAQEKERLSSILGETVCTASGAGPMSVSMAMKGGVKLNEVDPHTLESKLIKGLFFAGEILDLVGPCGGYNIRWAMASGRFAGLNAGKQNS